MYKVNDFFCGAGGMGLGFKQARYEIVGSWDFDKYAVENYKENVSEKVIQADISKMTWVDIPKADIWTFGFPCQDISVAGKQAGMIKGKTRSGLFYEIMRLLDETEIYTVDKSPKIILAENVKAVKKYLPEIEKEYSSRGYKTYSALYNSKNFGVPQNRERYFILGVHESIEKEFIYEHVYTPCPRLLDILEKNVDERYYTSQEKAKVVIEQYQNKLLAREATKKQPKIITMGNINPSGKGMNGNVIHSDGIATALTTNKGEGIKIYNEMRVRKLTPRECARLQGFPDDYKQTVSNAQFYKQMGNAVTVNVAYSIAEQIKRFLDKTKEENTCQK